MTSLRTRFAGAALIVGGLTTVAALLIPGTASADPMGIAAPLLNSNCTFNQVDAALHKVNPQLASMLDANPQQKAMLQQEFNKPADQRRADVQKYLAQHPQQAQSAQNNPQMAAVSQTIQQVADTCSSYPA